MDQLPLLFAAALIAGASLPLAVFDLHHHRLPNPFTYSMILVAMLGTTLAAALDQAWSSYSIALGINAALSLCGFTLFWIGGLGLGDVKYLLATNQILGFISPWLVAISLIVAVMSAAVIGLVLLARRKMSRKDRIAFGPFLVLGYLVCLGPVVANV